MKIPETSRLLDAWGAVDVLILNGLDASGLGCIVGVASDREVDPRAPLLQRLAAHLSSAYRCRRRLSAVTSVLSDSEAVLSPDCRVLDARGPAASTAARRVIQQATRTVEDVRRLRDGREPMDHWRPRIGGRWTLVDAFSSNGERYIVARENQTAAVGLGTLTPREQQIVAIAATGRSNKEVAYELGISHPTVRVLLARACRRLGVRTRKELFEYPAVRALLGRPPGDNSTGTSEGEPIPQATEQSRTSPTRRRRK